MHTTNKGDKNTPRAIEDVKAGDIIVDGGGSEAKVLAVVTGTFLKSGWDNFEEAGSWYAFAEAEKAGWKIKGSEEDTTRIIDGKKYKLIK